MKRICCITLAMTCMTFIWAQIPFLDSADFITPKQKSENSSSRSSAGCTNFIFEQDIALNSVDFNTFLSVGISDPPGSDIVIGHDDFTLSSTASIGTVVISIIDRTGCIPPAFEITFHADDNGSPGAIIDTRSVAAGQATFTEEGFNALWQAIVPIAVNVHIPITPVNLAPGTYWLAITSPITSTSFFEGVFWHTVFTNTGADAFGSGSFGETVYTGKGFAFALCEAGSTPVSVCASSIDAVCINTTVNLEAGGQANIDPDDVDGGSNGATSSVVNPSTFTCGDIGPNTVTLTVMDNNGNSDNCTAIVNVQDGQGLPNGWDANNIGTALLGNTFNFEACNMVVNDQYIITSSADNTADIISDNEAFASLTLCGNGSLTAKVENIDATGYGGLMIRESAAAGSKQISVFSNMGNLLRFESRTMTNAPKSVQSLFKPSPFWLRIRREGIWVHVEYSSNGMMFLPVQSVMISMPNCVEIGLASFTFIPMGQTSATFSNVSTTGNISLAGDDATTLGINQPPYTENQSFIKEVGFEVFPNPVRGNFSFQLDAPLQEPAMIEVLNLYGQSISQQRLPEGQVRQEWNTVDWPEGTYLIRINMQGQQAMMKKLVVTK